MATDAPDLPPPQGLSVDRVTPGRLLPANSTIQMLGISGNVERVKTLGDILRLFAIADAPPSWLEELETRGGNKAVIDIVLSSAYDDCWRIRSDQSVPQPQ